MTKLENLPIKTPPQGTQRIIPTPILVAMYVDYDLLYLDRANGDFYGNWRLSADAACKDKTVDRWIDRRNLRNETPVQACPGSKLGIWCFEVQLMVP